MSRRRWPYAVAAVVALLVLADAALWFAAEQALAAGFARWAAGMAAQGVVVTAGPAARGGFPLAATRSFTLSLATGPASLRSDRVVLMLSPDQPRAVRVRLPAPVAFAAPWLPPLALTSPDWRLDARLDGSGAVATDARDLTMTIAAQRGPPRQASAALLHLQAQPLAGALDIVGSAQSIALPEPRPGEVWPLGRHLASVAFEASLSGRLPPPSASGAWPDAADLAAWRDSGGAVVIKRLALGYGPLGVSGGGRAVLDAALQPAGQADLTVLGYAETLDALVAAHVLTAHAAQAAGAVLGLLARAPAGGGAPEVALGVTVRDRTLSVAGFPLLRAPPLSWPAGGAYTSGD